MAHSPISRRRFILGTGVALGSSSVLLAACGGSDDDDTQADADGTTTTTAMHHHDDEFVPGVLSSDLFVSPEPQRIAFTVLRNDTGEAAAGKPARLAIAPPGGTPTEFVDGIARFEGLPEFRGVYTVAAPLTVAGAWSAVLEYEGTKTKFAFQVNEQPTAPAPGAKAPTAASPTPAAPLGVDPICTADPQCPLHDHSLDALIGKGRPVAVLFATPARCQSAYCGPVLDTLLPLVDEYPGVDVVHVDIYKDMRSDETSPTVTAWGLPSEPWLFTIDAKGVVKGRLDGAFDAAEMRELLKAVSA